MKFEKNIKENIEKTKNKEQSKVIKDSTEMELTDEKMDQVAGGLTANHGRENRSIM